MKISLLTFGIAKEILGAPSRQMDLAGGMTVLDLKLDLETAYPALKKLHAYVIAVNDEYAEDDLIIQEQDEIAIIPPVSGG